MKIKTSTSIVYALFMSASMAVAAGDWSWRLAPYGWLAGLDGEVGVGRLTAPVDLSFSDVLEDLSLTAMLAVDAGNDRWGVAGDLFYVQLDSIASTPAGPASVQTEQWIVSGIPYIRVRSDENMTFDVGAGARYVDTDLDVGTAGGRRSGSKNWVDPVVMLRAGMPLTEKLSLNLSGDVGGFGFGSDFTWQLSGNLAYAITQNVDLFAGYRHIDIDYEEGPFVYRVATSGFGIGVSFEL